ncbi:hypothetical protein LOD99_10668 [Oopsacas minuta]|uniref:Uncharacterized protein n=1 Tax=Oopsacas minuta TaxID=111878 RepID=A0AAV7KHZ5_9METZ|nr:hypothetical protein LOD99_10668 [Oopsacas minuta]
MMFVFALHGILGGILSLFIHPRSQFLARVVLLLYSLALTLLYSAGIIALTLQWDSFYFSRSYLGAMYQDSLLQNYGQPTFAIVSGSINSLQRTGTCCGYYTGDDYLGSNWLEAQLDFDLRPFSCCESQTASCSVNSDDYYGEKGCRSLVDHTFSLFYWILLAVVISANFLIFLLISMSTLLISCLIN